MSQTLGHVLPLGAQAIGTTALAPPPEPEIPAPAEPDLEVQVEPDGGVTIRTKVADEPPERDDKFDENLAMHIDSGALAMIAEDVLEGIASDLTSRQEFIANYARGMELLGLKIETATNTKAQKRNVSRVTHPVMLEAVVRAQSMARGEMLPAAGPCKVNVPNGDTEPEDDMARALEADMNTYLTEVAREYYPDMDRGLFSLFYSGNLFKKVYTCPIKRRPVAPCIDVNDLIVSEDATDLDTALRVTHRSYMVRTQIKRMQYAGVWREVNLDGPSMPEANVGKDKQDSIMGITPMGLRTKDQPREIYETMVDLDPLDYGFDERGAPPDLPLPYVVTIDKASRQVLAMRRGWKEGDPNYERKQRFVHYAMVPGFGFLALGFLHLLGNQTKAMTAAWRLIVDAGMFANFPGGLKAKSARTDTNELQPSPGEFVDVDIGPFDNIQQAFMPMPYKDVSPVFISFMEQISTDAERMAGAVEMDTGEGKAGTPVGTIMAQIEQQTQVMAAVHKRLHAAQARELQLIKEEFAADPSMLARFIKRPARQWQAEQEFEDIDLVPASDPNVPSQMHRIMQATAMIAVAATNLDIYDKFEVHKRAWRSIGINDTDSFLHPAEQGAGQPPPQVMAKMLDLKQKQDQLQANMQKDAANLQFQQQKLQADMANQHLDRQTQRELEGMKAGIERDRLSADTQRDHLNVALQHRQIDHSAAQAHLGMAHDQQQLALDQNATHLDALHKLGQLAIGAQQAQTAQTAAENAAAAAKQGDANG